MPRLSFRIFALTTLAVSVTTATAFAQIVRCEQGPFGGPHVPAGQYGTPKPLDWNTGPNVSIPPGGAREIRCETTRAMGLDLVGTNWSNFTYSKRNSVFGGAGCPMAISCAVFVIFCDAQSQLRGPLGSDGEQSDDLEVCTLPGANQACRSIGRWDCDKEETALLTPGVPFTLLTPWGDSLTVPTYSGAAVNVTLSNAFPLLNPIEVPNGFLPITEAVTVAPAGLLVPGATLRILYSDGEVRGGVEETVTAFVFDTLSASWIPVPSLTDVDNNVITIPVSQAGTYGFSAAPAPTVCDIDSDGDVDSGDTRAVLSARGTRVSAGDLRDADGNEVLTAADAKICIAQCTRPRCEP
jgi:hypothetical protein